MPIKEQIIRRAKRIAGWDEYDAMRWFHANNPLLGGVSPKLMCMAGRGFKVLEMLDASAKEHDKDTVSQPSRPPRSPEHPKTR